MKMLWVVLYLATVAGAWSEFPPAFEALSRSLPGKDVAILLSVGDEYELNSDELKLLLSIRRIENGRQGLEMGVAPDFPRHPARRYAYDPERSLRVQARWAAGTIKKRYAGDVAAFAKVYCPPRWEHWTRMARYWMAQN